MPATRVKWMLHGHGKAYRRALSLLHRGSAGERRDARGGRYSVVTTRGRRNARSMTSPRARARALGGRR